MSESRPFIQIGEPVTFKTNAREGTYNNSSNEGNIADPNSRRLKNAGPQIIMPRPAIAGVAHRKASEHSISIGALILLSACIVFGAEISSISSVNGWWVDELISIWATDPSRGFVDLLSHRILPDPNQPLYLAALFAVRHLILDERSAIVALNLASLAAAFAWIGHISQRAGVLGWALGSEALFLLSGPVLRYVPEGRGYLMALALSFVAAWHCALASEVPEKRPALLSFALVGMLAAPIHPYAALMVGGLATGMAGTSFIARRKELLTPGLTLGFATFGTAALWVVLAFSSDNRLVWVEPLSIQSVLTAYWDVRQLALGSHLAVVMLTSLFIISFVVSGTRSLIAIFGIAVFLFLLVPVLISLKQPMLAGRYWLIGAPGLIVFVTFTTRSFLARAELAHARSYVMGAIMAFTLLVIIDVNGFFAARADTDGKLICRGAALAAPLLQHCAPGSVHVTTEFRAGYAILAHSPEDVFASVDAPATKWINAKDSACPVLGWAEHVFWRGMERLPGDFVQKASAEELLQLLKIQAAPSEVDIRRYTSGFVVLKRGAFAG